MRRELVLLCGLAVAASPSRAGTYTYTSLDIPSMRTTATGIDIYGDVTATAATLDGTMSQAAVFLPTGYFTFGNMEGDPLTIAAGINKYQTVLAAFDDSGQPHAFLRGTNGFDSPVHIPTARALSALALNNTGMVIGDIVMPRGGNGAFVVDRGTYTPILPSGAVATSVASLNDAGTVVGAFTDGGGVAHAFEWQGGSVSTIDPSGATAAAATYVGKDGTIAGDAMIDGIDTAFLNLPDGTNRSFAVPGATATQILAVLAPNRVIGNYVDSGGIAHAFYFFANTITYPAFPGAANTVLAAVNAHGVLAGNYLDTDGIIHAFRAVCAKGQQPCVQ